MSGTPTDTGSDLWSTWLLHDRSGGDSGREHAICTEVRRYTDRLLDAARLEPGMTLADVGTGNGEVAFRAIDRVGASLQVVLTDISVPLLDHVRALAEVRGVSAQCTFLQGSAESLDEVPDATVDAVTTRAVLAYVVDKRAAFREAFRVLKPDGRLSVAEPMMREEALQAVALRGMIDAGAEGMDPLLALIHRWKAAQFPDTAEAIADSAITNYAERDLIRFAEDAGFVDIHLELHVDVRRASPMSWESFIRASPHPLAPTLSVILQDRFTPEERRRFETAFRQTVESGLATATDRVVYLSARRPATSTCSTTEH